MTDTVITLSPRDTFRVAMIDGGAVLTMMIDGGAVLTISPAPVEVAEPAPAVEAAKPAPLFSPRSPWNSRPIKPVLGADTVPATKQTPWIETGPFASKIFRASTSDGPVTIAVVDIANQLEASSVTIPRFPANVIPATGSDGHCEVLDPDGTLHSFFQLKQTAGKWSAGKYTRSRIDGSGFGTVANPDNARAAGCSTAGGLLLESEFDQDVITHALAIGLDKNGIAAGPVFPATLEDYKGGYSGKFPMGGLLMLPPSFDISKLGSPELRKVAQALKDFGGYVVDATEGSMNIYAEIRSKWNQSYVDGKYSVTFGPDMQTIKAALRRVASQAGWLDGNGVAYTPTPFAAMNLLSMRGPWEGYVGSKKFGRYDAATDLYQAEATIEKRTVRQLLYQATTDRFAWKGKMCWNVNPEPGAKYIVTAVGVGEITAKIVKGKANSGGLAPGQSAVITWPTDTSGFAEVFIDKPAGAAASIRLELVKA